MRQLQCQVDALNTYTNKKVGDVNAERKQTFVGKGPSADPNLDDETKAAVQLRMSRDQMQQILQLLTLERIGNVHEDVGDLRRAFDHHDEKVTGSGESSFLEDEEVGALVEQGALRGKFH
jgi:hypothetical protein